MRPPPNWVIPSSILIPDMRTTAVSSKLMGCELNNLKQNSPTRLGKEIHSIFYSMCKALHNSQHLHRSLSHTFNKKHMSKLTLTKWNLCTPKPKVDNVNAILIFVYLHSHCFILRCLIHTTLKIKIWRQELGICSTVFFSYTRQGLKSTRFIKLRFHSSY